MANKQCRFFFSNSIHKHSVFNKNNTINSSIFLNSFITTFSSFNKFLGAFVIEICRSHLTEFVQSSPHFDIIIEQNISKLFESEQNMKIWWCQIRRVGRCPIKPLNGSSGNVGSVEDRNYIAEESHIADWIAMMNVEFNIHCLIVWQGFIMDDVFSTRYILNENGFSIMTAMLLVFWCWAILCTALCWHRDTIFHHR